MRAGRGVKMAHGPHHYKDHNHRRPFNINDYGPLLRKDGALRHFNPASSSGRMVEEQNKQPNVISFGNPHIQKR